jgi:hypothetical protein
VLKNPVRYSILWLSGVLPASGTAQAGPLLRGVFISVFFCFAKRSKYIC